MSLVMLDASVLLTEDAAVWLQDETVRSSVTISENLWILMNEGVDLSPFGVDPSRELTERLLVLLESVPRFSFSDAVELSEEARAVLQEIRSVDSHLANVIADEWLFLTTQSLGVFLQKVRYALEGFARAGARIFEIPPDRFIPLIRDPESGVPQWLLDLKSADNPRTEILLVLGGELAKRFAPHLDDTVTLLELIRAGVGLVAGDP